MQLVATVGITLQMHILVKGQFGKSLNAVHIYALELIQSFLQFNRNTKISPPNQKVNQASSLSSRFGPYTRYLSQFSGKRKNAAFQNCMFNQICISVIFSVLNC